MGGRFWLVLMTAPDIILAVVVIALWNGYLIYRMNRDDKKKKAR